MDALEKILDEQKAEMREHGIVWKPLGECCTLLNKKRKSITKVNRTHGDTPYYGANGIIDYVDGYLLEGDYILVGAQGSVERNGHPVIVWASGKIWPSETCHVLAAADEVCPRWLYHVLHTIDVSRLIQGSTIPSLRADDLLRVRIPVPRIDDQIILAVLLDYMHDVLLDSPGHETYIDGVGQHGKAVQGECFDRLEAIRC